MSDVSKKKRLMYLSGEDFYLLCYSILVILDSLGCSNGKYFRDYRKLAFLIEIITNEKTAYIITNSDGNHVNPKDHERLLDSYSNGLIRRSEILKLLFVLEKRDYVILEKGKADEINVTIDHHGLPIEFLQKNIFSYEYENMKYMSKKVRGLASLTLDTMLTKIYRNNGIRTWGS